MASAISGSSLRARKQFGACGDSGVCDIAFLVAQGVEPSLERQAQSGVDVHFGGVGFRDLRAGKLDDFVGQREVSVVLGFLAALPGVQHAPLDFAGGAIALPPLGFAFEQISDGAFGMRLLDVAGDGESPRPDRHRRCGPAFASLRGKA